jgi:hypothetical protein
MFKPVYISPRGNLANNTAEGREENRSWVRGERLV